MLMNSLWNVMGQSDYLWRDVFSRGPKSSDSESRCEIVHLNFSKGIMTSEWVGFEQTGHYLTTIYHLSSLNYSYTSIFPPHYLYLSISPNFALLNHFLLWRDDGDCHVPTHSGQLFRPGTRGGERGAHPRGGSGRRVTNIETF